MAKFKVYDLTSGATIEQSTAPTQVIGFRKFNQVLWRKSFKYVADPGVTTLFLEKFSIDVYLMGGGYWVGAMALPEDYIEFEVFDKDNVLGYGPNVILARFIETEYVVPDRQVDIKGNDDASLIPAGVYVRTRYVSTGAQPVKLISRCVFRA